MAVGRARALTLHRTGQRQRTDLGYRPVTVRVETVGSMQRRAEAAVPKYQARWLH
jgi:hypothetical protein